MASDEDYTAFLNKANQDPGTGASTPTSRPVVSKFVNTDIPQLLLDVKEYYVSDADEPFQPVSLTWKRHTLPSEDEFAELIDSNGEVTSISQKEFDPKGQYKSVITTVEEAGNGEASVFRTQVDKVRVEYYIVSMDVEESRVVGLKAVAIES